VILKNLSGSARFRSIAYRALQIVSLGALILHFGLTALYVAPINPMKFSVRGLIAMTVESHLPQDWRVFAPVPVTSDEAVLVRCLTLADHAMPALPRDGWYDISTPLWQRYQKNRFSGYDRLSRPQTYAARTYLTGGMDADVWYQACYAGSQGACDVYNSIIFSARSSNAPILARLGSAFCKDIGLTDSTTHVAMRVRRSYPYPWSARNSGLPRTTEDVPLGIFPFNPTVQSPGVFTR